MTENEKSAIFGNPQAFRQRVRLASVQVSALSQEELAFALAYEVEPFSGIPAAEADVAWNETSSDDASFASYDVAVVRKGKASRRGAASAAGGSERFVRIALVVACALVAAVAADWAWTGRRLSQAEREVAARRGLDAQVKGVQGAARAKRAEVESLRAKREAAHRAQGLVSGLRRAYLDAMDAVAGVCGGATVVREFKPCDAPFSFRINAVAPSAESAAEVMAKLTDAAAERGWKLSGGSIATREGWRTAEFDCRLDYVGAATAEGGAK